jgi:hypothetical protein
MTFRNIDVPGDAPVERWGFEGVLAAFERGDLPDWHRVYVAYRDDTRGNVRAFVDEALLALEQGDIRPELAAVFRTAVKIQPRQTSNVTLPEKEDKACGR